MLPNDPADLRREYITRGLSEADVLADPLEQFQLWFDEAQAANLAEPNAMTLATTTPNGRPAARIVLLKGVDAYGFLFYTNYESRKAQELKAHPHAALVFWWDRLERQVRIEGTVAKIEAEASDDYFARRPRGSRLGAWASPQSQVIDSREALVENLEAATHRYENQPVPRPPHWGGYRLTPHTIEFWQGRTNRLHDRLRYHRDDAGSWLIERLAP